MNKPIKKLIAASTMIVLVLAPGTAMASDIGDVSVNGQWVTVQDDRQFYLDSTGNTMLPADFLPLLFLEHEQKGDTITITGGHSLTMTWTIGEKTFSVNGKKQTAPVAPVEKNGAVYLPLRALISAIGDVDWTEKNHDIHLITDFGQLAQPKQISVEPQPLVTKSRVLVGAEQTDADLPIDLDYDGTALYASAMDELGRIKGLQTADGQHVLIPVQKDANLLNSVWRLTEQDKVWSEYAYDGEWRLYEQARHAQSSPHLIDAAPIEIMEMQEGPMYAITSTDKYIAYVKWNDVEKALDLILYDRIAQRKKVIDTTKTGHFNLALNDDVLVWTQLNSLMPLRNFGTLTMLELDSGQKQELFKGASLGLPVLSQNGLTVFYRPYGMNIIDQPDGSMLGRAVWHYNLKTKKWDWRLDNTSSIFQDGSKTVVQLFDVKSLNDQYAIVIPESLKDSEVIPAVNLAEGTVSPLGNDSGQVLKSSQQDGSEETVMWAKTAQNGNLLIATVQQNDQGKRLVRAKELRVDK